METEVVFHIFRVTALRAEERIWVLIVNITASTALEGVLTTHITVAVTLVNCLVAPWTEQYITMP